MRSCAACALVAGVLIVASAEARQVWQACAASTAPAASSRAIYRKNRRAATGGNPPTMR